MSELLAGERVKGETAKAIQACNDYLLLGRGRSMAKLLDRYQIGAEVPPTKRLNTLKTWSTGYGWQSRAALYDSAIQEQKTALAIEAMQTGLALIYERVLVLKKLAETLAGQIWNPDGSLVKDNIWLKDAKQIGRGALADRVDLVHFNADLIEQFRGVLDDLARETGGRKQQIEHGGPAGGPIQFEGFTDEERITRIGLLLDRQNQADSER